MAQLTLAQLSSEIRQQTYLLVRYSETCDRFCLEQHGLTVGQAYILMAFPTEGSITMNELSEKMHLANSTTTRMVDPLVQKDLAKRVDDPNDRRVVRVLLTERGGEVKGRLEQSLQNLFELVLREIPEEQRIAMLESLRLLNQSISHTLKVCCQ